MNSRERFETCFAHRSPDRPPIDYLAHPQTDRKLKEFYGIASERELLDILGSDFYYLSCRDISQNESCDVIYKGPQLEKTADRRVCPFGIQWTRGAYTSKFAVDEAVGNPLRDAASEQDILDYPWPKAEWFDFEPLAAECEANADRVIVGGFWSGILGDCYRMHGFENFLFNLAMNPQMIKTLVGRMTDFYLAMNDAIFTALRDKIDIWFFGNDFGSQQGLLFSVEMFSDIFMDDIRRLCALARQYGIRVMMHSCGAITQIIPLLIEAGVEILDPVQVTAEGMDPASLKDDFGERIVFHGGIDTQQVLPNHTPDQVREHVIRTATLLGAGGGYITAPSQILAPDIPVENIDIMYRTANELQIT